jgi:hypothetical protein
VGDSIAQPHPAADAFPMLDGDAYTALRDDIAAHGMRVPIVLTPEGQILDGRNRMRVCRELGISPTTTIYDGDPVAYVVSLNLMRRHLNESQRAMVAARLATMGRGRPVARLVNRNDVRPRVDVLNGQICPFIDEPAAPAISQPEAAELLQVGTRSVKNATAVLRAAEEGTIPPERVKDIERGKATVSRVLKEVQHAKDRATAEVVKAQPLDDKVWLTVAPVATFTPPVSIDVIVTDPPYPREYLPVYRELAQFAARTLPPGGSLFVMAGQSYLPDILALMTPHLEYHWTLSYLTPGGQAVQLWERKVNTFWKPVLWFVNGKYDGSWHGDVVKSAPNDNDKRYHHWGQSLTGMVDLLDKHTPAGCVVCDPFTGGGATGAAALMSGRRFVGADCDADAIATTRKRLEGVCSQ